MKIAMNSGVCHFETKPITLLVMYRYTHMYIYININKEARPADFQ